MEQIKKLNRNSISIEINFEGPSVDEMSVIDKRDLIFRLLNSLEDYFGSQPLGFAMRRFLDNKLHL